MVKTPRTHHSKTVREPVTIDLQPGEVSRVKAEAEKAGADKPNETGAPETGSAASPKPAAAAKEPEASPQIRRNRIPSLLRSRSRHPRPTVPPSAAASHPGYRPVRHRRAIPSASQPRLPPSRRRAVAAARCLPAWPAA